MKNDVVFMNVSPPDVWAERGEPEEPHRKAAGPGSHSADGHPEPLAPPKLRRPQYHQAASGSTADGGGAYLLGQRTLLSAQQVCYLTLTCTAHYSKCYSGHSYFNPPGSVLGGIKVDLPASGFVVKILLWRAVKSFRNPAATVFVQESPGYINTGIHNTHNTSVL